MSIAEMAPGQYAAAFEVLTPVHLLPQRPDAHGVSTEKELAEMAHRALHAKLSA